MSTEENKAIARRQLEEVWNKGRVEFLKDYWALDVPAGDTNSVDELSQRILWFHKTCPGFYFTIKDIVGEGDNVVVNWKVNVHYSVKPETPPAFTPPPFGKPVEWKGMTLYRFREGKVIGIEAANEWASMMIDTGAYVPAKTEPA
jgi:predicted ester cyclase